MKRMFRNMLPKLDENPCRRAWIFGLLSALILLARFPEGVFHAELWGEVGWIFYPDAYVSGIRSLLWPDGGYLDTIQRLGALIAVWIHLPLLWLPTFFMLFGLSIQLSVALFLLSDRLAALWPSWKGRAAFTLLYLCLPNSFETYGTLTNSQWHAMLLALLVILAPPAASRMWRVADCAILLIAGLSGPFCLIMLPLGAFHCWKYRRETAMLRQSILRLACLTFAAGVQAFFILQSHNSRKMGPLGASLGQLIQIVAHQVVLGLFLGMRTLVHFQHTSLWRMPWLSALIDAVALSLIIAAFVKGRFLFRGACLYGFVLFALELSNPAISPHAPQWPSMTHLSSGQRYYLVPMLVLAGALFTLAGQKIRSQQVLGIAGLAIIFLWAVPADFFHIRSARTDYEAKARAFDLAPSGTRGSFPEHPLGMGDMVLVKK
jgi:hypothetical protein